MSTTPRMNVGIPRNEPVRQGLFYLAVGLTALLVTMLVLGLLLATGHHNLETFHAVVGYASLLVAVLAAVAAWRFAKVTARKGVFYHALSLPILMVLQIGLAEMHQKSIHMAVGIAILVAVVGLLMMVRRPIPASI